MAMRWTGRLAAMGALAALIMAVPALADEAPAKAEAVPPRIDTADFAERPFVSRPVLSPESPCTATPVRRSTPASRIMPAAISLITPPNAPINGPLPRSATVT